MDMSTIPTVQTIVLTGLDFSMKPAHARFESSKGYIKPFPKIKVMHTIKTLAVLIYNQEKLTPYFHKNVCDGRNSLAYFICAVHRQSAPQPLGTSTPFSGSDSAQDGSNEASSTCELPSKNCELPRLCTTSMLPLGHWDSLYYAVVSEIRMMREDLEKRHGFGCEIGNPVLHYYGTDGNIGQPVTAIDLAQLLETAWYTLMDHRLVATLDNAVRMRNLRQGVAKEENDGAVKQFVKAIEQKETSAQRQMHEYEAAPAWPPPIVDGLLDICGIVPEVMFDLLWDKYRPEINQACLEDFQDESMLTAYRAELHAKEVEAAVAVSTPLPSATFCKCQHACLCKLKCDKDSSECTCMNGRIRIYYLIQEQESKKNAVHTKYVQANQNVPNQFLGAATPILAQMQIAALAEPTAVNVEAARKIHTANSAQELRIAKTVRDRSDTNTSRLAYVPDLGPPHRAQKDFYPLNFYGGHSPQRYPKIMSSITTSPFVTTERPPHSIKVPLRKPVPAMSCTEGAQYDRHRAERFQAPQPATPSTKDHQAAHVHDTSVVVVTYPSIPRSHSQDLFTQGVSDADAETLQNHGSGPDVEHATPDTNDPANEYISLLGRHPSTLEYGGRDTEPFPILNASQSPSPPRKPVASNTLPTIKTLNAIPEHKVPQPDFMAPRPGLKQRYVSAGGTAKLSERAEIAGPALKPAFSSNGITISKEELDAKLSDPEWVRQHFGESAVRAPSFSTPPRQSAEAGKRSSARRSQEVDHSGGEKRNRTSSGAGVRMAKLKRVFSSKRSSESDDE